MRDKYTEALGNRLVKAYTQLGAVSFSCDAVGIHKTTFYDWMHRGERGEKPYQSLYFRMRQARAAKAKQLMVAARKDKGGPQFLLERLFPAEFGASGKSGRDAMQTLLELVFPLISESARGEVLDALDTIERRRSGGGESELADSAADRPGSSVIETTGHAVRLGPGEPEPGPE
jgi:transposase